MIHIIPVLVSIIKIIREITQPEMDWAPSLCSRTMSDKQDGVMALHLNEFWASGHGLRQTWLFPLTPQTLPFTFPPLPAPSSLFPVSQIYGAKFHTTGCLK